ncbi:hypothetical protein F4780DRAFT_777948 [Xylariomycetidae sp. FL0641]|nr:hypothetical protein F4780DRAFT_777948 [Xylariomycetidae sp. FL0641]
MGLSKRGRTLLTHQLEERLGTELPTLRGDRKVYETLPSRVARNEELPAEYAELGGGSWASFWATVRQPLLEETGTTEAQLRSMLEELGNPRKPRRRRRPPRSRGPSSEEKKGALLTDLDRERMGSTGGLTPDDYLDGIPDGLLLADNVRRRSVCRQESPKPATGVLVLARADEAACEHVVEQGREAVVTEMEVSPGDDQADGHETTTAADPPASPSAPEAGVEYATMTPHELRMWTLGEGRRSGWQNEVFVLCRLMIDAIDEQFAVARRIRCKDKRRRQQQRPTKTKASQRHAAWRRRITAPGKSPLSQVTCC